jgi:hypothetical protein
MISGGRGEGKRAEETDHTMGEGKMGAKRIPTVYQLNKLKV